MIRLRSTNSIEPASPEMATNIPQPECIRTPKAARFIPGYQSTCHPLQLARIQDRTRRSLKRIWRALFVKCRSPQTSEASGAGPQSPRLLDLCLSFFTDSRHARLRERDGNLALSCLFRQVS